MRVDLQVRPAALVALLPTVSTALDSSAAEKLKCYCNARTWKRPYAAAAMAGRSDNRVSCQHRSLLQPFLTQQDAKLQPWRLEAQP